MRTEVDIKPDGRYSTNDAVRLLGVSRETLRLWVNSGRLRKHTRRVNGRPVFYGTDLIAAWKGIY